MISRTKTKWVEQGAGSGKWSGVTAREGAITEGGAGAEEVARVCIVSSPCWCPGGREQELPSLQDD